MRRFLFQKNYNNVWFWIKIKNNVPDMESKVHKVCYFESKLYNVSNFESKFLQPVRSGTKGLQRVSFRIKSSRTRRLLNQNFRIVSDFKSISLQLVRSRVKILQLARFWIKILQRVKVRFKGFTTCQIWNREIKTCQFWNQNFSTCKNSIWKFYNELILNQNVYRLSDSESKIQNRVWVWIKLLQCLKLRIENFTMCQLWNQEIRTCQF